MLVLLKNQQEYWHGNDFKILIMPILTVIYHELYKIMLIKLFLIVPFCWYYEGCWHTANRYMYF